MQDSPRSSLLRALVRSEAHQGIVLYRVSYAYPYSVVLQDVALDVPSGATVVIRGSNGSGKSTLLFLCAGLVQPQSGQVSIGGHVPDPSVPGRLFRAGVRLGFVFQEGGLLSSMNVLANVALPLRYHADSLGINVPDVEARAVGALERVQIRSSDYYTLPAHLSFGVRRRLALARAVALQPNFFFFDDPDVGLDPETALLVHEILCGYRDDPSVTTLVATNRAFLIDRLASPTYALAEGRLVLERP